MNIKKYLRSGFSLLFSLPILLNCSHVYASTSVNSVNSTISSPVYIEGDLSDPQTYQQKLNSLLEDKSINEVIVIDSRLKNQNKDPLPSPQTVTDSVSPNAVTVYRYRITDINDTGDIVGTKSLAVGSGQPGMTIKLSKTVEVSNTYSLSANVIPSDTISAEVGFEVTEKESVTVEATDEVPSQVNGRQVKSMSLKAYPVYDTKTFTIERHKSVGGVNYGWSKYGSGKAGQAYGVSFKRTYVYK